MPCSFFSPLSQTFYFKDYIFLSDMYFSYSILSLLFLIISKATDSWYNDIDQTYYWMPNVFIHSLLYRIGMDTEKVAGI